jgi:hypothetical protein
MLTVDSETEFLFGHSTDTLGISSEKGAVFTEAFAYVTEKAADSGRIQKFATIFPDKKYNDVIKCK